MEEGLNFQSLLIITVLAFLIPIIVSKIKGFTIPVVIAEVIAGIIVGKSGFDIVHNDLWIEFLSSFGFAYLMFLSGLEIDFKHLRSISSNKSNVVDPIKLGLLIFAGNVILAFVFAIIIFKLGVNIHPLFIMLVFCATSLGIVVPTLKEKNIISKPIGQTILVSALIADLFTMIVMPIAIFFVAGEKGIELLFSLLVFFVFAILYFVGRKYMKFDFSNPTYESMQLKVRAAFALVLLFVTISQIVNVEIILGAFLAGMLFSLLFEEFRDEIVSKLDAIGYGFLIPIFFIMVGVKFDLGSVLNLKTFILLPLLVIGLFLSKIIPSLFMKKFFTLRETIGSGFLISSGLSLVIAISLVAWKLGIIDTSSHETFVLLAIVTSFISPIIFMKLFPESQEESEYVVLVGDHQIIASIANRLYESDKKLILINSTKTCIQRLNTLKVEYILWDDITRKNLDSIKNSTISVFAVLYDDDEINVKYSIKAKNLGINSIVSVFKSTEISMKMEREGIKSVTMLNAMSRLLQGLILYPDTIDILYTEQQKDSIIVKEVLVNRDRISKSKLRKFRLPGDCLVLLIVHGDKRIIPDGNTEINFGDKVIILGHKDYIKGAMEVFHV